jgi:NADP-dependent 3-hydroxy acid dehydrogenase YdfG
VHAIELDVRDAPSFERAVTDWDDVFDVNLRGVVHGIQAVYPIMIRQRSGHIVNTASTAGLTTTVGQASYTAAKHAVVALSRSMRVEAERHGVRVPHCATASFGLRSSPAVSTVESTFQA